MSFLGRHWLNLKSIRHLSALYYIFSNKFLTGNLNLYLILSCLRVWYRIWINWKENRCISSKKIIQNVGCFRNKWLHCSHNQPHFRKPEFLLVDNGWEFSWFNIFELKREIVQISILFTKYWCGVDTFNKSVEIKKTPFVCSHLFN